MTAFSYSVFAKGGPVMWLLVLLGLVALVIFIERALFLHRGQISSTEIGRASCRERVYGTV